MFSLDFCLFIFKHVFLKQVFLNERLCIKNEQKQIILHQMLQGEQL